MINMLENDLVITMLEIKLGNKTWLNVSPSELRLTEEDNGDVCIENQRNCVISIAGEDIQESQEYVNIETEGIIKQWTLKNGAIIKAIDESLIETWKRAV